VNLPIIKIVLILLFTPFLAFSVELPDWITNPVLDEGKYGNIICSQEALDPDKARQLAEDKCYLGAARAQGVDLKVTSRSTQTLIASEVSESVESVPIVKFVKCDWQKQFIERNNGSYRVWLKCRYLKESISPERTGNIEQFKPPFQNTTKGAKANSVVRLLMIPKPEVILVQNYNLPERVIRDQIDQNIAIDLRKGDKSIIIKHHLYRDYILDVSALRDGEILSKTIYLEKEL
jgi:hypothetical protein